MPQGPGVYCIRNQRSGKVYIGSSVDPKKRWALHRWHLRRGTHHNSHLQRAWNQDGENAFRFDVLEWCSVSSLVTRETWWMDLMDARSRGNGYNFQAPIGSTGRRLTDETKAKISAANKGKPPTRLGAVASAESRARMSAKAKARGISENMKAAQLRAVKGVPKSPQWKAALSERNRGNQYAQGRPISQKHHDAIVAANKRRRKPVT